MDTSSYPLPDELQAVCRKWFNDNMQYGMGVKVAARLGIGESQVSRFGNGDRLFHWRDIPVIADVMRVSPPPEVLASGYLGSNSAGTRRPAPLGDVLVVTVSAPTMWRRPEAVVPTAQWSIPAHPDPRLKGLKQYGIEMPGRAGFWVCVEFPSPVRSEPLEDDELHIVHHNKQTGYIQETVRIVEIVDSKVQLRLTGEVPQGAIAVLNYPLDTPQEHVEIKGKVISTTFLAPI